MLLQRNVIQKEMDNEDMEALPGIESLKCSQCDFSSDTRSALKLHELYHLEGSDENSNSFECEVCLVTFPQAYELANHLLSHDKQQLVLLVVYRTYLNVDIDWTSVIKYDSVLGKEGKVLDQDSNKDNVLEEPSRNIKSEIDTEDTNIKQESLVKEYHAEVKHAIQNRHDRFTRTKTKNTRAKSAKRQTTTDVDDLSEHDIVEVEGESDESNDNQHLDNESDYEEEIERKSDKMGQNVKKSKQIQKVDPDQENTIENALKMADMLTDAPFDCPLCGKRYTIKNNVKRHIRIEHKNNRPYCKECHIVLKNAYAYTVHMRAVHAGDEQPHHCDQCERTFKTIESMRSHKKHAHVDRKHHQCTTCGRVFSFRQSYVRHKKIHAFEEGTLTRSHQCHICPKVFKTKGTLDSHIKTHSDERPFVCSYCSKAYKTKIMLNRHVYTHTGETPFVCEQCGKGFGQKEYLKCHIRMHTGEKPYECKHCPKTFRTSNLLKVHTYTHTGEKPFVCKICGKGFSHSSNLTKHRYSHSDQKPYNCTVCDQGFVRYSQFQKHADRHHQECESQIPLQRLMVHRQNITMSGVNPLLERDQSIQIISQGLQGQGQAPTYHQLTAPLQGPESTLHGHNPLL